MKKNILIVLPWLPYPYDTGGNQAVFNEINAIRGVIDVHLVCFDSPLYREYKNRLCADLPGITIDLYPKLNYRIKEMDIPMLIHKIADKIEDKFYAKTYRYNIQRQMTFLHEYNEHWAVYIKSLIDKYHIDVVQTEFINTLGIIDVVPENVKTVFVHHELRYVRNELLLSNLRERDTKEFLPLYKRVRAMEIGYLNMYDAVITLSAIDADKLRKIGVSSDIYSSFAIVQNRYEFKLPQRFDNRVTFVGPENHKPNKIGITWFLEYVWPKIQQRNPMMRCDIIGNWTDKTKSIYVSKYRNIRFLGFVDQLSNALRGSIMIVPITIGSGIRMKIQEAAQIGVPFVTTTVGVEGLPFQNNKNCFIADKEQDFADCVIRLQDNSIQQSFAKSAYNLIIENYSLENLQENRLRIYNKIMEKE